MVANSSVNQGAGFVVASLAEARRRGIAEDRLIYVGMGAAAKEPPSILHRDRYDGSVSMETSITRTLELNAMTADDFDFVELYSCFPCVPKMARSEEHKSELQSLMRISYAVFCLKNKKTIKKKTPTTNNNTTIIKFKSTE